VGKKFINIFLCSVFIILFIFPPPIFPHETRAPLMYPLSGKIITGFREEYFDHERSACYRHTGIDICGEPGEKVAASGNGTVSYTGFSPTGGLTVVIRHNVKIRTTYLNLASICVHCGDMVRQGDMIGRIGADNDPSSSQCHLHFGIIYEDSYLDPVQVLDLDYDSISPYLSLMYVERDFKIY